MPTWTRRDPSSTQRCAAQACEFFWPSYSSRRSPCASKWRTDISGVRGGVRADGAGRDRMLAAERQDETLAATGARATAASSSATQAAGSMSSGSQAGSVWTPIR